MQAEPTADEFNKKALKPAAKAVGDNAEDIAEKFNKQMTDTAGTVGKNAVPVTEDATENYIKPAAEVCASMPLPLRPNHWHSQEIYVALTDLSRCVHSSQYLMSDQHDVYVTL